MFTIQYSESVANDLAGLRAFDRRQVLDQIEKQLVHRPARQSRNKKILVGLVAPWEHEEPVWELRVGEFRVFYEVNQDSAQVFVRAIRHKPPHKRTEEIL